LKLKSNKNLYDKSFHLNNCSDYNLFLQISKETLKFAVLDKSQKTFIGFTSYSLSDIYNDFSIINPLKEILKNDEVLKNNFKKLTVFYTNNRSTLIPDALFNPAQLKEIHQFNFSKIEEDAYLSDKLINLQGHNVYSIPQYILDIFKDKNNVQFKHFSSPIIEYAILNTKENAIYLNILPNTFQITIIKDKKLIYFNSFDYQTSEDFIYYLLFVLDQLQLDNEKISIHLFGEIEKNAPIYEILKKYIYKVEMGNISSNLKMSYIFENISPNFYHPLFNGYLCE